VPRRRLTQRGLRFGHCKEALGTKER